ncbi:MAG TPA: M20 family metallopeptidase [Beijerinckiaceae bacterium]|nr:M20 family metallopeptidase [Beijerinckiaceae bacterium]
MHDFDTAAILAHLRRWVEIESPSDVPSAVNAMVDALAADYARLPVTQERVAGAPGFGDHLIVRSAWGQDRPGILLLSHSDTVHPLGFILDRLPFRIEGDRAYGPGIYDMKGGLCIAYHAFAAIAAAGGSPLGITHLIVSDEEIGSPSSRPLIERLGKAASHVLVTEPARDGGKIVVGRKGTGDFRLTIHGRASHAGTKPEEGRSAVRELAHQILQLEALSDPASGVTVTVGVVRGGTRPNVVPDLAEADVDIRVPTLAAADHLIAAIRDRKPVTPDVTIRVTGGLNRPPFEQSPAGRRLFDLAHAEAAKIGIDLVGVFTGGGSDGNFTAPTTPTLDGLGVDGAGAHTDQEHALVSSMAPRADLLRRIMMTLR